eukprot:CAMPEP_0204089020 /NCGR_PEP_ID=MMETSP0360-20130528/187117_1 /ASSEMBLY_ACC=CAM_ASM_000342 /TAXON_ID=268821 /ORGANISM="Scrippsiella Hangoei, Strain SHTV-5" /LENGTH=64 /DNA_ID=CAMNT_0051038223 /DNA_START=51 /DNA_END=241 /DNA_ORIENTATION=-
MKDPLHRKASQACGRGGRLERGRPERRRGRRHCVEGNLGAVGPKDIAEPETGLRLEVRLRQAAG